MPNTAGSLRSARWTAAAVTVAVLAGLIALGIAKLDFAEVGRALAGVSWGWLAVAMALMMSSAIARAESWFAAIRSALPDRQIRRSVVTRVFLVGNASSTVAPGRVGEAARAWLIAQRVDDPGGALPTVVGTLLSQTLLNLLALSILAIVVLAGSAIHGAQTEAIILASCLPAGILIALIAGPRALSAAGSGRAGPLARFALWIARQLRQVRRGLSVFRRPTTVAHSATFQLAAWGMQWGACYSALLAFHLERHAALAAAAVLLAGNITAIVPLTPSNVGIFQATCIAVLAPFGVAAGRGLAYGLVLQAVEMSSALVLGLPAILREGVSLGDLRRRGGSIPEQADEHV